MNAKIRARNKAWRKAHPGYHLAWQRKHRAKRKTVRILGVTVYLGAR